MILKYVEKQKFLNHLQTNEKSKTKLNANLHEREILYVNEYVRHEYNKTRKIPQVCMRLNET